MPYESMDMARDWVKGYLELSTISPCRIVTTPLKVDILEISGIEQEIQEIC